MANIDADNGWPLATATDESNDFYAEAMAGGEYRVDVHMVRDIALNLQA